MVLVGKGFLYFSRGDKKRASDNFQVVRDMNLNNIQALLGMAILKYNNGEYFDALHNFQNVLKADFN